MKRYGIAGALLGLIMLSMPMPAFASSATFFGPIVPPECHCDNQPNPAGGTIKTAPDYGCVLQTVQNGINFSITIAVILFTLYTALAGFRLVTSGGSSEARSQAKTSLLNVIIGLVVILCAWLIVDFVMKNLYNSGQTSNGFTFGPWNAILQSSGGDDRCIVATSPTGITTGTVDVLTGSGTPIGPGGVVATGPIPSRICSAGGAYRGSSTAAGPAGGRLACAWAVNNVLRNAGVQPIGGDAVRSMENALRGGRGQQISQSQAVCGDIVIEAGDSHVGICMNSGCTSVISNSSSKATFSWPSSITFAPTYSSGPGRIYRVIK